ncbi:MAG: response regulator [Anaerolineae bacterium]|nr:response regulator [Anaerolineae bacterium]
MKFDRSLFIGKFSTEAEEHLQKLNDGVLRLERAEADADPSTPSGQELMAEILRAAHTLKGSARMMGFKDINQVAHKLEDLLLEVKESRLAPTPALCDLIFRSLDVIDASRQAVVDGREGEVVVDEIVGLLERAAQGETVDLPPRHPAPPVSFAPADQPVEPPAEVLQDVAAAAPELPLPAAVELAGGVPKPAAPSQVPRAAAPRMVEERIRVSAPKLDKTIRLTGEVIAAQKRAEMRQEDLASVWQMARAHRRLLGLYAGDAVVVAGEEGSFSPDVDPLLVQVLQSGQVLVEMLDRLVKQSREHMAELGRIVMELQQDTLGLRMLPVSTVFDTFPRAVRDLARERGKEVDLVVKGGGTELDKQMLERLSDPLMHMLRNSVDHGLEPPDDREARGKPRRGTIWLRAFPAGGSILIEVEDDGRGIDLEAIRRKALDQKLADEEKVRSMSQRELQSLIFLSGFSTSRVVSDVSGRGVGLDVVRRNVIEDLKGDITVDTEPGQGTRFTLTLPLTLTTLRTLFVRVGSYLFGLPVNYIDETTRVRPDDVIQVVDQQAIRLRDQIVPIERLRNVLPGLPSPPGGAGRPGAAEEWLYLVIAQVAGERVGFVVDEVVDEEDVLIKPLPKHLKRIGILAGATIAPNGAVIPILHVPGLVRAIRFEPPTPIVQQAQTSTRLPHILVVDDSLNTREIERTILEAEGYRVDLARDGLDALRVIEQASKEDLFYDLLIVDIEMPRLDGLSLTARLREEAHYQRVPIIIVSSRDQEEDRRRGLDAGADAYIVKGTFDQEDLTTTVASLLGRAAP